MEKTFALIKPEAVSGGNTGKIIARIEEEGFSIKALKMISLSRRQAENFYAVHREKAFFEAIVAHISSSSVVALVLEKDNAVADFRQLMGATNPAAAEEGTLRRIYGQSVDMNGIHGSDSVENAAFEMSYFSSGMEINN